MFLICVMKVRASST